MIKLHREQDCCGCSACEQVCARHAISLQNDKKGFLYPVIDVTACNQCGLCNAVCPIRNEGEQRIPSYTYAVKNKDEKVRLDSSSGGLFSILAEQTINKGGKVYGALFDENWNVVHSSVAKAEDIFKMRGSKYVQSILNNTFKYVKADLKTGLDSQDVSSRVAAHWDNVNDKKGTRTVSGIIFSKIFTIFNLLCFGIAAWLISVGAFTKCFFILIVTSNIIIGIVQDLRAKAMIDKLSILSAPTVNVLRDGQHQEIEVKDIVVDDIMLLTNGKQICSDSVVIEGFIEVNESLLTGESDAIQTKPGDVLYSGSFVVSGACKARVEKVGEENYIQKLTKQARKYEKPKSEIMRSLNIIIRVVGVLIFILGPIYFLMCYGKKMGFDGAWFGD